jgi:hypothetical protein
MEKKETEIKASAGQSLKAGLFGGLGVGLGGIIIVIIVIVVILGSCIACCIFTGALGSFTDSSKTITSTTKLSR